MLYLFSFKKILYFIHYYIYIKIITCITLKSNNCIEILKLNSLNMFGRQHIGTVLEFLILNLQEFWEN